MKNAKKIIAFLMALTLLVSTIQMPVMAATTKKATIKMVSIVKPETKTLVLKAKKSYQLKTKVTVNGKISKKVTYESSLSAPDAFHNLHFRSYRLLCCPHAVSSL